MKAHVKFLRPDDDMEDNFEAAVNASKDNKGEAPSCSNSAQKTVPRRIIPKSKEDAGRPAKRTRTTVTEYAGVEPTSSLNHVAKAGSKRKATGKGKARAKGTERKAKRARRCHGA